MIDVAVLNEGWDPVIDWAALGDRAARAALSGAQFDRIMESASLVELAIRLADDDAVRTLNREYRGKDTPTNVLSFPMLDAQDVSALDGPHADLLLGDIILAHGVCVREAKARQIPLEAHATHLIIHGVLHLLGFDHIEEAEAVAMENLERTVLLRLGLHDPYGD
jgi:probable rRNA maturation factor